MIRNYKNLVFTNHGAERLNDRTITADAVWQTIHYPEKRFNQGNSTKFTKVVNGRLIYVIATYKPAEQNWVVISCWVRGENDQEPLIWQLLLLPFKLVWWLVKQVFGWNSRSSHRR